MLNNPDNRPHLRLRFTLRQLLGIVALIALAVPALMHASLWWAAAWLSGYLLALGIALLGIVYRDGARRAFWIGFALFGWEYVLTVYGPVLDRHVGYRLITTKALAYAQLQIETSRGQRDAAPFGWHPTWRPASVQTALHPGYEGALSVTTESGTTPITAPQWDFFQQVGHSLLGLVFAYVGGLLSRWFYATRSRP